MPRQKEVACRYGCGKMFPYRTRMETHLSKCPNRPECPRADDGHLMKMLLDLEDRFDDFRIQTERRISTIERTNRRLREQVSQTSSPECFDTKQWIREYFSKYDTIESINDHDRNMVPNFGELFSKIKKNVFDFPIIMLNLAMSLTPFIRKCHRSRDHVYVNVVFPDKTMCGRHTKRAFMEAWHTFAHYELGEWFINDKMISDANFRKVPYKHLTHEHKLLVRKIDLRIAKKIARDRVAPMALQQDKRDLVSNEANIKNTFGQLISYLINLLNELT